MENFKEAIAKTQAIIFDVDGVLTDGGIIPTRDGDFIRKYNAKDGYAIAYALKMGYKIGIITGGRGENLRYRLEMLHLTDLYLDCANKVAALEDFCAKYALDPQYVIYMGDDIPDMDCMKRVGIPVCPADAATEILELSRYVSQYDGGRGCARDILEQVLRARGDWAKSSEGVTCSEMAMSR